MTQHNDNVNSLRARISRTMISLVVCTLMIAAVFMSLSLKSVSNALLQATDNMSETSAQISSRSMQAVTESALVELVRDKASLVDEVFADFLQAVSTAADAAQRIYDHPSEYQSRLVALPKAENDGKLTVQLLLAPGVSQNDPAIRREIQLIGNIQDTLLGINANLDSMASNYIATASGFMVQADYISASKFDGNGNLMPLEARQRPWYQGAVDTRKPYLTSVTKDAHSPRLGIMCGVPIFHGDEVIAVSGAGMYLDGINEMIQGLDLKSYGNVIIVNQNKEVLFSTFTEGDLAAISEIGAGTTLNEALLKVVDQTLLGNSGIQLVEIDGAMNYVAYARMETADWAFFIIIPQEVIDSPTQQMVNNMNEIRQQASSTVRQRLLYTMMSMLALLVGAVLVASAISLALSRRISNPIQKLTEEVSRLQGDNLDFNWEMDTRDETQQLANSFKSLTERMKNYIDDIQRITADKERIDTELSLAKRIQTAMLPAIFPPYPGRNEFDIFALMNPAREIGGDFYDIFLIDDDHLALVISDVSGKGIPAALFMMISKTILQSCAMLGKSPAEILTLTNEALCSNNETEMFITAWIGILEISTGKLTCANAGHEYPFISHNSRFEMVKDKHGFIIGGLKNMAYSEYSLQLTPGDCIFVYTDGVPEANDSEHQMFGLERLDGVLNEDPSGSCRNIVESVWQALEVYSKDTPQFDDVTMLCLRYLGPQESEKQADDKSENS